MAIYRGPGGTGDAVNDASSEALITIQAKDAALAAQAAAELARDAAQLAETNAETAETNAETAETNAETAATNAAASASAASTSASNAATSATNAANSATAAQTAETNAETAETNAAASASAASTSASNAATSATNASNSASAAATSATNASNSASAAATSATNAANSATAAQTAQTAAELAETNAETAEANAETAETNAAASASAAATSATNASNSASAASTSATNASNSASAAATSATNASNSASAAATSASNAATSETNAANSATAAASSYDSFDDRYLGAKSSAPTLDNDGNTLLVGALYYDTVSSAMKVWSGSAWLDAYASLSGALIATNNLSDLNNTATARTNLGVAIGTDVQAYDAQLADVAGLTPADNNFIVGNGTNFVTESGSTARTSLGLGSIATQDASNVAITGGSINGTTVGASTASSGAFTTLSATGDVTIADKIVHSGDTDTAIRFPAADTVTVETSGSERLRIDTSGNVGIGTSSPAQKLHVGGNQILQNTSSSIANNWIRWQNSSGTFQAGIASYFNVADTGNIEFLNGSTTNMMLSSSGNLGIGTSSPAARLNTSIASAANTTHFLMSETGTTGSSEILIRANNSTQNWNMGAIGFLRESTSDNFALRFFTAPGATNTERMRIDSSGNVLVGRTSVTGTNCRLNVQLSGTSASGYTAASNAGISLDAGTATNGVINLVGGGELGVYRSNSSGAFDVGIGFGDNSNRILRFDTAGSERMRIDSSGNVGIGTSSPGTRLQIGNPSDANQALRFDFPDSSTARINSTRQSSGNLQSLLLAGQDTTQFYTNGTERMRITSGGDLLVGKTEANSSLKGVECRADGLLIAVRDSSTPLVVNRLTNDGTLVSLQQATTEEGTISVSGTTVSYNGGHLSRYAQTTAPKDESLVKGTVLSNLDEMNEYVDAEGNQVPNEQLNKVNVSDVEGDVNVAGVFVNWSHDEQHNVDEINMAMTGDMIIRIAEGVVVQKGDLLMSAGDGTAKPQGDDIVRSKTIAKVTSNHVTCTYADGSYCVPCVLMAC